MSILKFDVKANDVVYNVEIHKDDLNNRSWVGVSTASARAYAKANGLDRVEMNVILAHRMKNSEHFQPMINIFGEIIKLHDLH